MNGQTTSDVGDRECWAEYFRQPPAVILDTSGVAIPLPDSSINEEPSTLIEVREAIPKLNCWKTTDMCDIPPELLKAGGKPMARGLHAILEV